LGGDDRAIPIWLRFWKRFPLVGTDPIPKLLDRGYAWLIPLDVDQRDPVPDGWRVETGFLRRHE
jgi:hypothetical protein